MLTIDKLRPELHFTPPKGWMNDPNGLFWRDGTWHLYYQSNPHDIVWGEIHWGHATSPDLLTWTARPPVLAPSPELGVVASGCVVVDHGNVSALGVEDRPPILALFTHLVPDGGPQVQSLAVSHDGGHTFVEWPHNPVLVDAAAPDFRDPKVIEMPDQSAFVMVLAAGHRIRLYRSTDLLTWTQFQSFGAGIGAHGGVWECPDLFALPDPAGGDDRWVMLVSVQNGGPNGGSGMQYFIGALTDDGFVPDATTEPRWLDWGPDCYAGITFFDAPASRRVMVAWMSNWRYADRIPTTEYRGAMTLPRELSLVRTAAGIELVQTPVIELASRYGTRTAIRRTAVGAPFRIADADGPHELQLMVDHPHRIDLVATTSNDEELRFTIAEGRLHVDRSDVVPTDGPLADPVAMPLQMAEDRAVLQFIVDRTSVEVFADGGARTLSLQIHPQGPIVAWRIAASEPGAFVEGHITELRRPDGSD